MKKAHLNRTVVLRVLDEAVDKARYELDGRGLHTTANAMHALKDTTTAVASKVKGWENNFGQALGPLGLGELHDIDAKFYGKAKRKTKRKLSPKQKAALAKGRRAMAAKRRPKKKAGRIVHRKPTLKKAAHTARRKRRTPAQIRATKRMIAANRGRRRGAKRTHRRYRKAK